jgi:ribonucleotide reductase alpha subunit
MAMAPDQVGIGIRRHFTRAGEHPYDTVQWENRDARIPNYKSGGDAFFQPGVEFPVTWSQNSTNIVAQKYFRGQLGSPERESSLRQVIDRVADTIADWGVRDGYFTDEAEADAFRDELKYLLLHQRAAFNSPVWFNIGVKGVPAQASACFILAVEDTMSAILNWYVEEGTIFKGGSGSGINLSNIRSSMEPLAGGGTASGPVSFMRGADASAGTIKCLHADTDLVTDHGVVPIRAVAPGWKVLTRHGMKTVLEVHDNGIRPLVKVRTGLGDEILCTPEHKFRVRGGEGEVWREAGRLRADDYVMVDLAHTDYGTLQRLEAEEPTGLGESPLPAVLDEAFAVWLGWAHGEGRLKPLNGSGALNVHLDGEDRALVERYRNFTQSVLGQDVNARTVRGGDAPPATVCPPRVARFLQVNGLWRNGSQTIPRLVRSSPAAVRAAFLAGLFESDGHVQHGIPTLWSKRRSLALEAHRLLLSIGIPSKVTQAVPPTPQKGKRVPAADPADAGAAPTSGPDGLYRVRIIGEEGVRRFAKLVGFVSEGKARLLEAALRRPSGFEANWFFPHVDNELERIGFGRPALRAAISAYRHDANPYGMSLARAASVQEAFPAELDGPLARFAHGDELYVPVSVEAEEEDVTYDLTVEGVHEYLVHNAVTHNSGGKTRRAAKMVILNVDHPDVEQFIWCKAVEERKARALAAAGFDMDLDGADSHSTQYQNANNSVRVTDEFMEAVVNDRDWALKAVKDGKPLKTVRARKILREISEAAWECADPGMQYDTTINRWHTASNTGRINASNPCSEYMSLDNSACNLASLNLLKFLNDDGSFDVTHFKAAVEVVFTAQEILVGNADYPTQKIAETTRRFRQLGLGYANLGALLMAQGLPYDSEAGRAWAAAITALMTGHAYATSARTAGRMGPHAGYAENREPMLKVLRMHRNEVESIDESLVPDELLSAAREAWDEAVEHGEVHGVRNSQASVLAPTGCLIGGSLVATDKGLVRLRSLGDPDGPQWQELALSVLTDEGPKRATRFYVNGLEPVVDVRTKRGYRIQGTTKHRIKVVTEAGRWEWRRMADLRPGDMVPLAVGQLLGDPQVVSLPPLGESSRRRGERHLTVPRQMTADLAEVVGYFMGDGSRDAKGLRLRVAGGDPDVVGHLERLAKSLFGIQPVTRMEEGDRSVELNSVRLTEWWDACGFGTASHLPDAVLHSNDPEVYGAFLRGLYEADGTVTMGYPSWTTTSLSFSQDVQALLLALGFITTRSFGTSGRSSRMAVLRLLNKSGNARWLDDVGFISARKAKAVATGDCPQAARDDHIPVSRALIDRVAAGSGRARKVALEEHRRSGSITRRLAEELFASTGDAELGRLLGFFFDRVKTAELGEEELTYDLSVPENVTYVANGFVSHNTIGLMMDCDTTGIEPDLALTKAKKLVGGGTMFIVNQTVPRALKRLGYSAEQVTQIVAYIDEHKTILGAPGLRVDDLPVFACAMGDNPIHYMGHVKMMAAVQPFISGAISKCVVGETLVSTGDGLVRIGSLYHGERPDSFRDEVIEVASLDGVRKTDAFYYGGVRPVREVALRSGHKVIGTPNHRLLVAGKDGLVWRRLDEIEEGESVALRYGAELWSLLPAQFDGFEAGEVADAWQVPTEMSAELAFLLGAFAATGRVSESTATVTISHQAPAVLDRLAGAWRGLFGLEARITTAGRGSGGVPQGGGRCPQVAVTSETAVAFLEFVAGAEKAAFRRIPAAVLASPRDMLLAYLQGLLANAGVARTAGAATVTIALGSATLLEDLQSVLTNLGVVHRRVDSEVVVSGDSARDLFDLVPPADPQVVAQAAEVFVGRDLPGSAGDFVPNLSPRELYFLVPTEQRDEFAFLRDAKFRHVTRSTLDAVAALPGVALPDWLATVVADGLHFSAVERVASAGEREVYDLSVPVTHAFVGNGIVNHNTINMPEEATVEDVEDLHIEAWRMGLKAIAIYRDNCKVGQPLSIQKSVSAPAPVETRVERIVETIVLQEPVRQKLPRRRNSKTFSFRVADCHGYVIVGEFEDGRPGEIFLKVAKQGSTLAGIMDAFAISVSHGLQYGVPLKAFVDMFTNMRFEPAGITDDPEIRLASSLVDYIFRRLAVEYLTYEERVDMGILTIGERSQPTLPGVEEASTARESSVDLDPPADDLRLDLTDHRPSTERPSAPTPPPPAQSGPRAAAVPEGSRRIDAPYCYGCGMEMQRAGSCYVCSSCGATSGCS